MPRPFTDLTKVEEVMNYHKNNLSLLEISKIMRIDRKTIYRWYACGVGKRKITLPRKDEICGKLSTG